MHRTPRTFSSGKTHLVWSSSRQPQQEKNTAMKGDIWRKPATQEGGQKVAGQRGKSKWEEEPQV